MNTSNHTLWAQANTALQNREYDRAVALYQEALCEADDKLKRHIRFNLQLAKRHINISVTEKESTPRPADTNLPQKPTHISLDVKQVMKDIKDHFDVVFYQNQYPGSKQVTYDYLEHFCTTGWYEGRDPRADFSTATYLELNGDVATAGINPFWHYVIAGKAEGRQTQLPGGNKAKILKNLPAIEQVVEQWKKKEKAPDSMSATQIVESIKTRLPAAIEQLLISVSHDNYKKVSGGVQLCIQREEQLASQQGVLYLNAHPWEPLPVLASKTDNPDPFVYLVLAGEEIGLCRSSELTLAIKQIKTSFHGSIHVVVHSLLGHSVESVISWVALCKDRQCYFWLHDFFSLCPSYILNRNNITFCGAPPVESNGCSICIYGNERHSHIQQIQNFFESTTVTAIAPSEVTKQLWVSKSKLPCTEVKVAPHMDISWIERENPIAKRMQRPISIGFLGGAVHHKGWNTFVNLFCKLVSDTRFRFFYFGKSIQPLKGLNCVEVHVTANDSFAMSRSVSEAEIDYVLHWATWPETFSFTTYEAIAGGAYILTNALSGNVAATVDNTGMGRVFINEAELIAFFSDGAAGETVETIRSNRAMRFCEPGFSEMTLPFLVSKG